MRNKAVVAILVILLSSTPLVSAYDTRSNVFDDSTDTEQRGTVAKTILSDDGIEFTIEFDRDRSVLEIRGENTNDHRVESSGVVVTVDGARIFESTLSFSTNETWSRRISYESGLDALEKHHDVTISTFGDYARFNFTRDIESNGSVVPTPYISTVEIQNGTIDGEPSSVAKVTVVNPSMQTYPTKLMVHTIGTDGSFYGAATPSGESRTITVELLDERGTRIAGEARLYAGNFSKGNGAMDQVEFVGRAGGRTDSWNRSYEPVTGPWDERSYTYANESLEPPTFAEEVSGGRTIGGYPSVYPIAGSVIVLIGLLRRFR